MSRGVAGAILSVMMCLGAAQAAAGTAKEIKPFAQEYSATLAPVGFVDFCRRNAKECAKLDARQERVDLTPERWHLLYQVNAFVNGKVAPVSDQELYGQPEFWTYPTDAGDCEDYLLLKKRYLQSLGFPPESLRITVVLDEHAQGHAVLTVTAKDGDYVLDNRRNDIRRWADTGYDFLKRQSAGNPLLWVALTRQAQGNAIVAGQNRPRD
jgi:predicted transglutaminase-like cysteine proteinase